MAMSKRRAGRPVEVEGGQRVSIMLGARQLRAVASAARHHLGSNNTANRSRVIRQLIDVGWVERREDVQEIWKRDLLIAELQDRVTKAERRAAAAEAEAGKLRNKRRAPTPLWQRLAEDLPLMRQKAAARSGLPCGLEVVDQVWHNQARRDWGRLVALVELAAGQKQWPPDEQRPSPAPHPGGAP